MNKKKFRAFFVILLVAVLTLTACSEPLQQSDNGNGSEKNGVEPIKIGNTVALTGDVSIWGQSCEKALRLEVDKINAAGGINGRPIKLISYDNRGDSIEAVNVAKRLIEQDKVVAIIGPAMSGLAIAMSSVAEENKIPFIATQATNPQVTVPQEGKVRKYAFRTCFIDPFQGKVLAQFAYHRLNARKAAILYNVGDDYSAWLAKYFEDEFKKLGGNITNKEAFRSGELDYRAMLGKIKQNNPDVIFLPNTQKEAALAAKQARDLGIKSILMGGDACGTPDIVTLGGSAVEGFYLVNHASMDDPDIQDFVKEYKQKYGEEPVLPEPVLAVDALYLLVDAIKRAGTTEGSALAEALENTANLKVLTGTLTIDPKTHDPLNKPAIIQQIKNGEFVFVEKFVTN
ncbi:ABC transporter substrate-binding protein [Thermosediminibacter litoriperuensis]|uniref:Amino acid/amide ABC transporter substrate-binding protein, HAAT family (TC 3.A.1.4.-) n=1 Tax=Thermosediminibacter litoriperuensis TaxID=291989 RepID=A0A5S5AY18_9FIRM|nr:ABC transporter substrate-binding protein [Thermosediminibacter litoriperuensis]TYP58784.1 amino acid/amide ABC transporter substrate-binding protein, HAAT family (TC 3.A.1.4.-) [Thermosediminibacter litoriperuensis]